MRNSSKLVGLYTVLAVLLVLVAIPLGSVLVTAVTGYRGDPSAIGSVLGGDTLKVIRNTVWLSILVVFFSTIFAAPLALLRTWTRFRNSQWVEIFILIPFMTPPFALAMAWMDFTRLGGVADMLLGDTLGSAAREAIYSVWGMAFVMAAELFPFLYLVLRSSLHSISASSLEMAQVAGASRWQQFSRVLFPQLVGPYSLGALIIFIKAAGEFGTPVTLGNAIGYEVLVSSIYQDVSIDPLDFSHAAASSSILFSMGVLAWAIQQWISRRDLHNGGRVARQVSLALSLPWRMAGWGFMILVFLLTVIIPFISIVLASMTILRSAPPSLNNLTFDYFSIVLQTPSAQEALQRSIILGAVGASTAVILALVVTLLSLNRSRSNRDGVLSRAVAKIVDFFAIAPDMVPGIVLAIGFILLWNSPRLPWSPYGTMIILVMAFSVLFLPMAVQNIKAAAGSVSPTMHEAAAVSGAQRVQVLWRITLPLLAPGIFAAWILAFFVGIRELVMSSLIRPSNVNLLAPWIMNEFDQGHRAEAMAMTLIGVGTSTIVLILTRLWLNRRTH